MKRVLVTGGAKRLGAVFARKIAAKGWQPVLHYGNSRDEADALAKELGTVAVSADLGHPDEAEGLIAKAAKAAGGPLHGLVNNASIFEHDRPETVTAEALERHYRINSLSPVLLAKNFAAQAEGLDDPVIVNILDQKLHNLHADHFSYTLSKAALETASELMARSFAPKVRVCGVAPGYTLPAPGESEEDFEAKAAGANPMGRRLAPEDIAGAVLFCLENRAVTGHTILADNGEHLVPVTRDISFRTNS